MKKFLFVPKTKQEIFAFSVYKSLVENFPKTFFVGGAVRDFLLKKNISDIDIATSAKPLEVNNILKKQYIESNLDHKQFGVVIAAEGKNRVAIATFRKDLKSTSRYGAVKFVNSEKQDSLRRDFTINALYLSPKMGKILDFHKGLEDLENKKIKLIGNAENKIKQDPLRIVRALRFCLKLHFKLELNTFLAIKKQFSLLKNLTQNRIKTETDKLNLPEKKERLNAIICNKKLLDKFF